MIIVQDRMEIAAADLTRLQQLFVERYRPAAAQRGLAFVEALISPPLKLRNGTCTLWQRWQVADAGAWWAMRAQASTPEVAVFWAEVDGFCVSRERIYLTAHDAAGLPEPQDISPFVVGTRGHRETAQLALRDDLSAEDKTAFAGVLEAAARELPGLEVAQLAENLAPEYAAGHYTWDLLYPDAATADAARASTLWQAQVAPVLNRYCRACHALGMETLGAGLRSPGLRNGIKRTAYFRLLPGAEAAVAQRFERDLLEMPAQIPQILNWRLSRASELPWNDADAARWTHVWEQEFEGLEGLTGPYMVHPHHWAHIDRWFDPESGVQIVDVNLSHAFCPLAESIIAREVKDSRKPDV